MFNSTTNPLSWEQISFISSISSLTMQLDRSDKYLTFLYLHISNASPWDFNRRRDWRLRSHVSWQDGKTWSRYYKPARSIYKGKYWDEYNNTIWVLMKNIQNIQLYKKEMCTQMNSPSNMETRQIGNVLCLTRARTGLHMFILFYTTFHSINNRMFLRAQRNSSSRFNISWVWVRTQ